MARKRESTGGGGRADAMQIHQMFNLLFSHFDKAGMVYREDWSDRKIADTVLCSEGAVERYRIKFFGRLKAAPGQGLPGRVTRLEQQMEALMGVFERAIDAGAFTPEIIGSIRSLRHSEPHPPQAPMLLEPTKEGGSLQSEFERVAVSLLKEIGRPTEINELRKRLNAAGFKIPKTKDVNKWIGNRLYLGSQSNSGQKNTGSAHPFVRIAGEGWWLADEPYVSGEPPVRR